MQFPYYQVLKVSHGMFRSHCAKEKEQKYENVAMVRRKLDKNRKIFLVLVS